MPARVRLCIDAADPRRDVSSDQPEVHHIEWGGVLEDVCLQLLGESLVTSWRAYPRSGVSGLRSVGWSAGAWPGSRCRRGYRRAPRPPRTWRCGGPPVGRWGQHEPQQGAGTRLEVAGQVGPMLGSVDATADTPSVSATATVCEGGNGGIVDDGRDAAFETQPLPWRRSAPPRSATSPCRARRRHLFPERPRQGARDVPESSTEVGITLSASPPWICPKTRALVASGGR